MANMRLEVSAAGASDREAGAGGSSLDYPPRINNASARIRAALGLLASCGTPG